MIGYYADRRNVMIDLETLSLRPTAVIVSIAAVDIDNLDNQFYTTIKTDDWYDRMLHVDQKTVDWWKNQAKEVFEETFSGRATLLDALSSLNKFLDNSPVVWSYPANFDIPILTNSYNYFHTAPPWFYRDVGCYATLRRMFWNSDKPILPEEYAKRRKHHALDDAIYQAKEMKWLLNNISQKPLSNSTEK